MPSAKGKRSLLLIGNFLSLTLGARGACEDLAWQLSQAGWQVITASHRPRRLARLMDMVTTAWRRRREYEVACVEVYSGKAFFWAEAVCLVLRLAAKPYVLNLHGGALPSFARRWPGRVIRLLKSAVAVVTPSPYLFAEMKPYRQDVRIIPNGLNLQSYPPKIRVRPQPHLVWLRAFHTIYNPPWLPGLCLCSIKIILISAWLWWDPTSKMGHYLKPGKPLLIWAWPILSLFQDRSPRQRCLYGCRKAIFFSIPPTWITLRSASSRPWLAGFVSSAPMWGGFLTCCNTNTMPCWCPRMTPTPWPGRVQTDFNRTGTG